MASAVLAREKLDPTPLLAPRSIAVVGASDRPGAYGDTVLRNLERHGFSGSVWGVNPKRATIHGRVCVPTLAELPEPVDAVVIAIPAAGVPDVVAAAAQRGCGGAVVLSAGFREIVGGSELEQQIARISRDHGLPVCGPNSNGIIAAHSHAPLWGDVAPILEPGAIGCISQSGNVAVNAIGTRRGIRFHTIVSTGNQASLDAADWLRALSARDGVRSLAMFLEDDGDGAKLAEALAETSDRGVGVTVLKIGASVAGARAASSHTGSLAGDQRVFRALIEEAGAAWAENPHELLELARTRAHPPRRLRAIGAGPGAKSRVAVLATSGGDAGLSADRAAAASIELAQLSPECIELLGELLPAVATPSNPLDYTTMVWGDEDRFRRLILTIGADPDVGAILIVIDHPRDLTPEAEEGWTRMRSAIASAAPECEADLIVTSTLPDLIDLPAIDWLESLDVPVVAGLDAGLLAAIDRGARPGSAARLTAIAATARDAATRSRKSTPRWLDESEAKQLLRIGGVAVPDGITLELEGPASELDAACVKLGWPLVAKLTHPELRHKSDLGAVVVGIENRAALDAAVARLRGLPVPPGSRLLLERMESGAAELLISARSDGVVPALVVALGGIWTELFSQAAVIPLPASAERIEHEILSLRGSSTLTGARGRMPLDVGGAAALAARTGELLLEQGLGLIELNPVLVDIERTVAVDAVIRHA